MRVIDMHRQRSIALLKRSAPILIYLLPTRNSLQSGVCLLVSAHVSLGTELWLRSFLLRLISLSLVISSVVPLLEVIGHHCRTRLSSSYDSQSCGSLHIVQHRPATFHHQHSSVYCGFSCWFVFAECSPRGGIPRTGNSLPRCDKSTPSNSTLVSVTSSRCNTHKHAGQNTNTKNVVIFKIF